MELLVNACYRAFALRIVELIAKDFVALKDHRL